MTIMYMELLDAIIIPTVHSGCDEIYSEHNISVS